MIHITLSGSMSFVERMLQIKRELDATGAIEAYVPNTSAGAAFKAAEEAGDTQTIIDLHHDTMAEHIERIRSCDAILFVNETKNGKKGYMGTNTLIELGTALALDKKIYFLHEPDRDLPYYSEAMAARPTILHGDLDIIKKTLDDKEKK